MESAKRPQILLLILLPIVAVLAFYTFTRQKFGHNFQYAPEDLTKLEAMVEPQKPIRKVASLTPLMAKHNGFVSANTCKECHAEAHASWHRTFHRTMTQVASPDSVVAPFDGIQLRAEQAVWNLERRGDEFWVDTIDPIWDRQQRRLGKNPYATADAPRKTLRVVMTTGSHHRQSYWVSSGDPAHGNELHQIPWTYQIAEQKWIRLDHAFLQPAEPKMSYSRWNENCIGCHSVGGKPGMDPEFEFIETAVADLGIACEACHGPGEEHVKFFRLKGDAERGELAESETAVETFIVNPSQCSHVVSSHLCAGCHSFSNTVDVKDWWTNGRVFRPGQDLEAVRKVVRFENLSDDDLHRGGFWDDGTARTGGREYNSMSLSGCYTRGEIDCLSCHSMHNSEPDHQLASGMESNAACVSCHEKIAADIESHTHHSLSSSGSLCYNCHMPHTSYALLSIIRSHRIDSPDVKTDVQFGRPNACNLCHLDQTLDWTDRHLAQWYGRERTPLNDDQTNIAASLLWALRGDAAQRIIAVGNMGMKDARETSGDAWMAPFLALAFDDPYPAVRWVAHQSLQQQSSFREFEFNFSGVPSHLLEKRDEAIQRWRQTSVLTQTPHDEPTAPTAATSDGQGLNANSKSLAPNPTLLIQENGQLDDATITRLKSQRDNRSLRITE